MSNKVITGKVRFSYANVWEPKSVNGSDPKYSVSLIIPKSDKKTLQKVKAAIEAAKKDGISKLGGKIPANLKTPLRDGDVDRPDDEAYANSYFINANSYTKPGIVDKDVQPILDPTEFYSGCYGRASIVAYAYNANGTKGIAAGLQNLQKMEDGEPLGGRSRAEDDFGAVDDDDDILG
ncbi:MAG: DUF2815 family protein [Firmicutes bacterium]|nr:DUF2815 family protein [Bacillota bacterium]